MDVFPLPPPGEPPPDLPVHTISGARAEFSLEKKNKNVRASFSLEIISQASEDPSLSALETSSHGSVEQIVELEDRFDDDAKALANGERRISWVPSANLQRISNDDLQEAALRGDIGLVRRLVHAGASVNAPMVLESQDEIMTLLHVLALRPEIPNGTRIIGEIIRANIDIDARSSTGLTPLMCACQHKHVGALELLVDEKVDVLPEDDGGLNALTYFVLPRPKYDDDDDASVHPEEHTAADMEEDVRLELMKRLQEVGANFDDGGRCACPPIVEAVKQLNMGLVRDLLEIGAIPDGLPEAATAESVELIKTISSAKANPFVTDEEGCTALEIAEQNGNNDIADLLKAYIGYLQDINHHYVLGVRTEQGHPVRETVLSLVST